MGFGDNRIGVRPGIRDISQIQRSERDQGFKSLRSSDSHGGSEFSPQQELHRKGPARPRASGFLFDIFSCPQETHGSKANFKFEAHQRILPQKAFQNGISPVGQTGRKSRRLASGHRFVRCVHAHTNKRSSQKVSEIQNQRPGISVQSPPFRVSHGAQSFYEGISPNSRILSETGCTPLSVFGRLAGKSSSGECMHSIGSISDSDPSKVRLDYQFPQIPSNPVSKKTVHWGPISDGSESDLPSGGPDRFHFIMHQPNSESAESFGETFSQTSGPYGSDHRGGPVCEIANETDSIISFMPLETKLHGAGCRNSCVDGVDPTSNVVVDQGKSGCGPPIGGERARYYFNDRCQRRRLGSPSVTISDSRDVDLYGASMAHQQKGNGSDLQGTSEIPVLFTKQDSITQMRQYDYGHLRQQAGGDEIPVTLHAGMENVAVCQIPQYLIESDTPSRKIELHGRQAEQGVREPVGVDVELRGGEANFPIPRPASNRSVRDERESSTSSLLLEGSRRHGVPSGRPLSLVGRNLGICIPPNSLNPIRDPEGEKVEMQNNTCSPEVASKGVLPGTSRITDGGPAGTPGDAGPAVPGQGQAVAPTAGGVLLDGLEAERQYLRQEGIPEDAIIAIQNSIRPSTREQYSRHWKSYCSWCCARGYDPYSASVSMIIAFLQSLYNKGLKHGSLMVYRSAIARFHRGLNGKPVSHNVTLSKFMRGIFNMNPPKKSLLPTWNLNVVLTMLQKAPYEPLSEASLRAITLKCVFLVAITTAKRCSEIQALGRDPEYLRLEKRGYRLRTVQGFLSKTAVPGHLGKDIFVPSYSKFNKLLCAKRALKYYLKATENLKNHKGHLFVAFGSKVRGNPVSRKTIASWIVQVIRGAYESKGLVPPKCRAHSTRAMSTSWAAFQGVSFSDILRAADWRCNRTFATHYGLDLWKSQEADFGKKVLAGGERGNQ